MEKVAKQKPQSKWEIPLKSAGQNGLVMLQTNDHRGTFPWSFSQNRDLLN